MPTLYDVPLSPYAQKVKIALLEKDISFDVRQVTLGEGDREFAAVSPRGEVPALVDGDVAIFDSAIILAFLEDKWPNPPLLPATAEDRARVRMIQELCDTRFEALNWGLNEVIVFKRADGALAQKIIAAAGQEIGQLRDWLEGLLGTGDWFNGEAFGMADIVVFPYLYTAGLFKMGPVDETPLARWLERMGDRPSVQRVLAEAKEAAAGFTDLGEKFARGEYRRQYRDHRLEFLVRAGGGEIVEQGLAAGNIRFSSFSQE
jgi:glutathione S-transferase